MDSLQAQVLRALLTKAGWAEYADIVSEDVLTNTNVQAVYAHIKNLHSRAEGDLSPEAVRLDIVSTYRKSSERAQELCDVVDVIGKAEEVEANVLREAVQKFAQRELLARVATDIAKRLGDESLDVQHAKALIDRAVEVGEGIHTSVIDAVSGALPGEVDDRAAIASLGLGAELDRVLGGGVAAGELLVFVAPPSRGKTSYLCAAGARAAQEGRRVLHITLEVNATRVNRRYDSAWTGLKRRELAERPKVVAAARRQIRDAGGGVWIKDWSYNDSGVAPSDVKGLVRQMRSQGVDIDLVIVDYLELMVPNRSGSYQRREMRFVYGQIEKEMRAVGVALGVPILTAWQINRTGSAVDSITLEHLSESWDIAKHPDIILALNQSRGEADNNQMRIGVLKQRDGTGRPQVLVESDLDRCQIRGTGEEGLLDDPEPVEATAEVGHVPGEG
jgi:replicative DNA helicase